jgi:hypothetical protein
MKNTAESVKESGTSKRINKVGGQEKEEEKKGEKGERRKRWKNYP